MSYRLKTSIGAAIFFAGLYFVSSAFGQALKPIEAGDFFSTSLRNEIWRLPAGDTSGIGETYARPPSDAFLRGVATDKDRNLYYIYEIAASHVLVKVTAAGVSQTVVTMPVAGTQYEVKDFTASESGTVYILFGTKSAADNWIVRVGPDGKAIDHRSGQEVRGPFTSTPFFAGFTARLAVNSRNEVYVLTIARLHLAPAGAALQQLGTLPQTISDIEFSEGQLWGARSTTGLTPTDLVKISLPSLTVESKGTFPAHPILKAGSLFMVGEGQLIKVALDSFASTVKKCEECHNQLPKSFAATTDEKKKCPEITVRSIGTTKWPVTNSDNPFGVFEASGGAEPYAYSASGQLPTGSSFVSGFNAGFLRGPFTRHGFYTFTVTAKDDKGCTGQTTATFEVTCPKPYPLGPLRDAYVGQDYSDGIFADGRDKVRIVEGSLPPGLTDLPTETGSLEVKGKPTKPGFYFYTVEVTNDIDPDCKFRQTFRIIVGNSPSDVTQSKVGPKEGKIIFAPGSSESVIASSAFLEEPQQQNSQAGRLAIEGGNELYATAVISYRQNGVVVSEAAVPVSPPTTRSRFFLDYRTGVTSGTGKVDVYTGFAAVNRGSASASVTLRLRDAAGAVLASGTATLAAGAHIAKFVNQISEIAPDFKLPDGFATSTRFATLEIESDQPLSVLALRLTINQRGELLLTSTPGADLTQAAPKGTLYFPQLADGGGWRTALVLLNTSEMTMRGVLRIFDDNGASLSVKMESGASGSEFRYTIEPGGYVRLTTDGSPSTVRAGSVQLIPDDNGPAPIGAGIFSLVQGGILTTESGVPAAVTTTRARIYIDKSAGHDTGIAVAAAGSSPVEIRAEVFGTDPAVPVASGNLSLAGNGHAAKFAGSLVTGTFAENFTGVLEISAPTPFAALTLRSLVNERSDFLITTFPVADMTRAAPSPMVFPQVVAGGGYGTEFVILNAGTSEKQVTLRFFDETGKPAAVSTLVVSTASGPR